MRDFITDLVVAQRALRHRQSICLRLAEWRWSAALVAAPGKPQAGSDANDPGLGLRGAIATPLTMRCRDVGELASRDFVGDFVDPLAAERLVFRNPRFVPKSLS